MISESKCLQFKISGFRHGADGTDRVSRNVRRQLPTQAAYQSPRKMIPMHFTKPFNSKTVTEEMISEHNTQQGWEDVFLSTETSRHYFPVGEEQIAKQVWESALSTAVSKLEGNYCNSLRQRRYSANDCYLVQFKTVYERIITPLRVEWRLNSATAQFLFMAVIYSF